MIAFVRSFWNVARSFKNKGLSTCALIYAAPRLPPTRFRRTSCDATFAIKTNVHVQIPCFASTQQQSFFSFLKLYKVHNRISLHTCSRTAPILAACNYVLTTSDGVMVASAINAKCCPIWKSIKKGKEFIAKSEIVLFGDVGQQNLRFSYCACRSNAVHFQRSKNGVLGEP